MARAIFARYKTVGGVLSDAATAMLLLSVITIKSRLNRLVQTFRHIHRNCMSSGLLSLRSQLNQLVECR